MIGFKFKMGGLLGLLTLGLVACSDDENGATPAPTAPIVTTFCGDIGPGTKVVLSDGKTVEVKRVLSQSHAQTRALAQDTSSVSGDTYIVTISCGDRNTTVTTKPAVEEE